MVNIYTIIVTFNGMRFYKRLFDSLRTSTVPMKVVVIDNASIDGSIEYISSNYPEVIVFKQEVNLGFGGSNNIGIRYAMSNFADYVFLLNQDTWIEPNTLEILTSSIKNNPNYGILSPMHLTASRKNIESSLAMCIASYIKDKTFFEDLYFNRLKDVYACNFINAAAWLIPLEVVSRVGGFDPMFVHYGEDNNYVDRVKYHKFEIGICPSATIVHDTENRIESIKGVFSTNLDILPRLLDINRNINLIVESLVTLKKLLKACFKLNIKDIKHFFSSIIFILTNIKKIKLSREENKKNQPSWLS